MMNSNSTLNQSASYTVLIARTMEINSYGTFMANANYTASTPLPDNVTVGSSKGAYLVK
jgi:hypothetical protein